MSASIAIELQCNFLISLDTCCASSVFLELTTTAEYSFDFAKATAMAFPIPLLDPVTIATLFCIRSLLIYVRNICVNKYISHRNVIRIVLQIYILKIIYVYTYQKMNYYSLLFCILVYTVYFLLLPTITFSLVVGIFSMLLESLLRIK